jgi:hypothetical protein
MHSELQQRRWMNWHYSGNYPTRPFPMQLIPKIIKEGFEIEA